MRVCPRGSRVGTSLTARRTSVTVRTCCWTSSSRAALAASVAGREKHQKHPWGARVEAADEVAALPALRCWAAKQAAKLLQQRALQIVLKARRMACSAPAASGAAGAGLADRAAAEAGPAVALRLELACLPALRLKLDWLPRCR